MGDRTRSQGEKIQLSFTMLFFFHLLLGFILLSDLVRVGYTFTNKTVIWGCIYELPLHVLTQARTGQRSFQALYLGQSALATFQQIKEYEQRDPAAQKLQI